MASRNTVQKNIVLNALIALANHPTAEDVYNAIHAEYPTISKATVYRTLNKLSDEGTVLHVRINNGADHYDHQVFSHSHIRCTRCGRVDDVPATPLLAANEAATASTGYSMVQSTLQFDGLCPACQALGQAQNNLDVASSVSA